MVESIEHQRLVAIVRLSEAGRAAGAARAVAEGGLRVVEVSLTTPDALEAIEEVAQEAIVGAGTVRDVADAERAAAAGADFLLSPHLALDVQAWAQAHDVLAIPGAMTPTDVAAALDAGAPLVKLFPAGGLGPGYVRDLRGPFPGVRLIPTGGVDLADADDFLAAGAAAVALGGALVNDASARDLGRLREAARLVRATVPLATPPERTPVP